MSVLGIFNYWCLAIIPFTGPLNKKLQADYTDIYYRCLLCETVTEFSYWQLEQIRVTYFCWRHVYRQSRPRVWVLQKSGSRCDQMPWHIKRLDPMQFPEMQRLCWYCIISFTIEWSIVSFSLRRPSVNYPTLPLAWRLTLEDMGALAPQFR